MKHTLRILLTALTAILAGACTHNNGDIGPLFGTWALDAMLIDGQEAVLPDADTFMQFQNRVVMVKLIDSRATTLSYNVGSWQREADVLELDFNHRQDGVEPGTGIYQAPEWLHFVDRGTTVLQILSLKSGGMRLKQLTPEGPTIVYDFHKTH